MDMFREFAAKYRVHSFAKGEVIVYQDETPTVAYFIKNGVVKTYNITAQGEEKPISFSKKSDIFPVGWVFSKLDKAQYYYEALTYTEVYAIPRNDFIQFLHEQPEVAFGFLQTFAGRQITYQMHINALEQSKAADKVLHILHFLAHSFGVEVVDGLTRISVPMSQQDLANFMGLTRETTSIELKKLERKNMLAYERPYYMVNIPQLKRLLDQDDEDGKVLMPEFDIATPYNA